MPHLARSIRSAALFLIVTPVALYLALSDR